MRFAFDAFVTGIVPDRGQAAFALGDGTVRWEDGTFCEAHEGAILCAARHPSGEGVITGGDDGRLVWSRRPGATLLAEVKGAWIDALDISHASGLIAFGSGRTVRVINARDPNFERRFEHSSSVSDLAFDPAGRRLASASYGGVALWYARIAEQKPVMLRWAGSHSQVAFTPDGRFVISAMQEAMLHVWRLSDGRQAPLTGDHETKIRSLAFAQQGTWLATSAARTAHLWPLVGRDGPLGHEPLRLEIEMEGLIVRVTATGDELIVGLDSGEVLALNLETDHQTLIKAQAGPPISALEALGDGRVAWGDEDGGAGLGELSAP